MGVNEVIKQLEEIKYAETKVIKLKSQLNTALEKRKKAYETLEKENKDVEKITGVSFQSFIASLMNNREEKIEKEELEAIEAKRQYDAKVFEVEALDDEIQELLKLINRKAEIEKEYQVIYDEKKRQIMASDPGSLQKMIQLDAAIAEGNSMIKEIKEALLASKKVISTSRDAMSQLKEAKDFGVWDMMGGGLLMTLAKRERMDKAQQCINQMNYALKQLSNELEDINESIDGDIDLSNYMSVADYLFDNIFVDMMVQDKINDAISKVTRMTSKVEGMVIKLELRLDKVEENLSNDLRALDALIINS